MSMRKKFSHTLDEHYITIHGPARTEYFSCRIDNINTFSCYFTLSRCIPQPFRWMRTCGNRCTTMLVEFGIPTREVPELGTQFWYSREIVFKVLLIRSVEMFPQCLNIFRTFNGKLIKHKNV